ncbi:hypothetical protein HID58_065535, partial [Brassica napus]
LGCIPPSNFRLPSSSSPSLLSMSVYGFQSQGKAMEANKVPPLHQDWAKQAPRSHPDNSFVSCMTDADWNKDKLTA